MRIFKEDRILIAGSEGMVGRSIRRALLKKDYGEKGGGQILGISRKQLDLSDQKEVQNWFKKNKVDVVIIAAAKVGGILANKSYPTEFLLENLKIQNNLIENSWRFGVRRLLFLGSSCIYPKFSSQPIKEEFLLSSQLEESNQSYAIAKIAGLKLCESLNKQYKFDAISLMPTNLYGEGDNYHDEDSHVLPALIKRFHKAKKDSLREVKCWGTGSPFREFLHVDDLADAVIFALEQWDTFSENSPKDSNGNILYWLNVGTKEEITIKELAYTVSKIIGYEGKIIWDKTKPDGTPRKKLDISVLKKMGWEAKICLEKGIEKTFKSYIESLESHTLRN